MPAGRKAPAMAQPRGLPAEQVRNEIGAKLVAMDAIIAQCEARFGRQVKLVLRQNSGRPQNQQLTAIFPIVDLV